MHRGIHPCHGRYPFFLSFFRGNTQDYFIPLRSLSPPRPSRAPFPPSAPAQPVGSYWLLAAVRVTTQLESGTQATPRFRHCSSFLLSRTLLPRPSPNPPSATVSPGRARVSAFPPSLPPPIYPPLYLHPACPRNKASKLSRRRTACTRRCTFRANSRGFLKIYRAGVR